MRLIVDASVIIKWSIEEDDHALAIAVLTGGHELLAPDLALIEIGNILWKKVLRGEVDPAQAAKALTFTRLAGASLVPSSDLIPRSLDLAIELQHPIYDCIYLAAAERYDAVMVTADRRLLASVRGNALAARTQALSELRAP